MTVQGKRVLLAVLLTAACSGRRRLGPIRAELCDMAAMQGAGRPAISAIGTSTVQRKPTQLRLLHATCRPRARRWKTPWPN